MGRIDLLMSSEGKVEPEDRYKPHRYLEDSFLDLQGRTWHWQHIANDSGILDQTTELFKKLSPKVFWHYWQALLAAGSIAAEVSFTNDALLGCAISTGFTLLYWFVGDKFNTNMSWTIISVGVIFPISQGIGMAFKRREQALGELGNLLGNLKQLWGAAHIWLAKKDGAHVRLVELYEDEAETPYQMRKLFEEFLVSLAAYLDVPRVKAKHIAQSCCLSSSHAEQRVVLDQISMSSRLQVDNCVVGMQQLVQDLKDKGLPGGETHRLDQYVSKVGIALERIAFIKEYRTPQAFRAFARVYIMFVGALYGPYYVWLGTQQSTDTIVLSLAFGLCVQLVLSSLFTVMLALEDPFARVGERGQFDSIKIPHILEKTRLYFLMVEKRSKLRWNEKAPLSKWNVGHSVTSLIAGVASNNQAGNQLPATNNRLPAINRTDKESIDGFDHGAANESQ